MRDQLMAEANDFLMGKDPLNLLYYLQNNSNRFYEIGLEILNRRETIDILSGKLNNYSGKQIENNFPNLSNSLKQLLLSKDLLTEKEVVDLISKDIISAFNNNITIPIGEKGVVKSQVNIVTTMLSGENNKIAAAAAKRISSSIKGKLTSEKGNIRKIVKEELRKKTKSTGKEKQQFIDYFSKEFKKIAQQKVDFVAKNNDIEQYLETVKKQVMTLPNNIFTGEYSSMTGAAGEEFFRIITTSDTSFQLQIDIVGDKSENKIMQDEKLRNMISSKMKTYHAADKQSQTDMLITNKSGKTVRVQSKNLQEAYQSLISDTTKTFPGFATLQNTRKYSDLINALTNSPITTLNDDDIQDLSYLLANEFWFRTHGSYKYNSRTDAKGVSSDGTLGYVASMVNKILSKEVANFIGINIDDNINIATKASASNIFFLISNRFLLPTYKIIDGIIKQLKDLEGEVARLNVSIISSGMSLGSAKSFYKQKQEITGGLRGDGDYSDSGLLSVGTSKGQEIINQLQINKIGVKIDMESLLTSSYAFY